MGEERSVDVAIVGGGVAGAACGCAFGAAGVGAVVLERHPGGGDANRGDLLHAAAFQALERWGALGELKRRGAFPVQQTLVDDPAGRLQLRIDQRMHPLLVLNHREIERGLLAAAAHRGVELRAAAVKAVQRASAGWVIATDAGPLTARLLVAADGGGSLVRRALGIGVRAKSYDEAAIILHAAQPGWLPPASYWLLLHPEGAVLLISTTPAGRCRVVVTVPAEAAPAWVRAEPATLQAWLGARSPRLQGLALEREDGAHVYRLTQQHAKRYVAEGAALVGDAAHVTLPSGGQGMSLAIQDAAALAGHTAPVLCDGVSDATLAAALAAYERERRPRNARALRAAAAGARFGRPGRARYALGRLLLRTTARLPSGMTVLANRFGGA